MEIRKILNQNFYSKSFLYQPEDEVMVAVDPSPAAISRLPESEVRDLKEGLTYGSVGDSFTSLAWVNREKTDLTFDSTAAALYFPPLISHQKIRDCLSASECPTDIETTACRGEKCLSTKDGKLFLNKKSIDWPNQEFSKARITIKLLENKWLVGAIIGELQDEKIMVYSFDGKKFTEVLAADQLVKPNYPNRKGFLSFGGIDNDFLILYLGYDGLAYHSKNGRLENISSFFDIRVADEGFKANILRVEDGAEVFWYLTSETEWKQKFIKLWQNGSDSIEGLASFSQQFFGDWMPKNVSLKYLGKQGQGRNFKLFLDYGPSYPHAEWSLTDNGFDNSLDRKIVSGNLFTSSAGAIVFAKAADIGLNLGYGHKKIPEDWGKLAVFQFSNNGQDWLGVNNGEEIIFADQKGSVLYWQATLKKSKNKEYSPFFYHFNNLEYYFRTS